MKVTDKSDTCAGWMVVESGDTKYLFICGNKIARKKGEDIHLYTLSIDSILYRTALIKFLCLGWEEIEKIRDKQQKSTECYGKLNK